MASQQGLWTSGAPGAPASGETESDTDALVFVDDLPGVDEDESVAAQLPWRVLIVDDDEAVHQSTIFALGGETVLGRPLHFHQAYSGVDAFDVLLSCDGFALVLLDIVMETPDAGFELARRIREELKNNEIRIVVRTGQPGLVSEKDARATTDINRYVLKSELTQPVLLDVVSSEIRQFSDQTN
ncbi:hypothetical protein NUH88_04795 [Nisaea acidiphila]|uniref:Response regulatory domain-containing protein n=1 Tax=Nisaea acidiphila TaxID=1862145 RepID=A0A9J7AW33_9PROT|nr:hypothetical protein [Nisaea acidiphila]UUX51010.1 hypothetical protein NUH88_04795 [Nisaea acidiphila]